MIDDAVTTKRFALLFKCTQITPSDRQTPCCVTDCSTWATPFPCLVTSVCGLDDPRARTMHQSQNICIKLHHQLPYLSREFFRTERAPRLTSCCFGSGLFFRNNLEFSHLCDHGPSIVLKPTVFNTKTNHWDV